MEKLLIKSNGQWELEKAWGKREKRIATKWVNSGARGFLDNLDPADGKDRNKMLKLMGQHTKYASKF